MRRIGRRDRAGCRVVVLRAFRELDAICRLRMNVPGHLVLVR
jgi:hypothetical protein